MVLEDLKSRDVVLCDTLYQKPSKITNYTDYLNIIYYDNILKTKKILTIENPEMDLYVVKEHERKFKKPRHFLEKAKLDKKVVQYKNRVKEIAKVIGPEGVKFFKESEYKDRRNLLKYPYCLGADIDIETIYRKKWIDMFGKDNMYKPTKCFLDIEVDQINYEGNMATHGECPINAITIVDNEGMISHTFLLDEINNPLIEDFKKDIKDFTADLHESFDESYGVFDYRIYMIKNEVELITQVFRLIHHMKKDFCMVWNMAFDIPYIVDRLYNLGLDPTDIMCHSDFPTKTLYYRSDPDNFEFDKKKDYFEISSYTHYIDQLIVYAASRRSKGAMKKYSLGSVAKKEIGDEKLDYSDVGNFRTLPYENYKKFVKYNIKDVLLQYGIDQKVHDIDNMYLSSYVNCIGIRHTHKQTVSFRGLAYDELLDQNLVLGHNANFGNYVPKNGKSDDDDEGFEGAINGDPMLNDYMGLKIFGLNSKFLFGDSIDMDFSSMYPNSIIAFNIFGTTLIGKLIIANGVQYVAYSEITPKSTEQEINEAAGKEFVEDMVGHNFIHTGRKWFNLEPLEKVIERLEKVVT